MKKFLLLSLHLLVSSLSFCMDVPFDYGIQSLPKDLFWLIVSPDDKVRDALRSTCKFFSQKLSIKSPDLPELVDHPLFNTNSRTLQYLAFNAAWNGKSDLLKSLMRHMAQPDYRYQYELTENWVSNLDLMRIIEMKMSDAYNEIAETAKSYNCSLDFCRFDSADCSELKMVCYNKNAQLLKELLEKNCITVNRDLEHSYLYMLIDKNSDECLNVLLSYAKNNMGSGITTYSDCKRYQDLLEIAMKGQKYKAFESLVANNVWCDLNFAYRLVNGRSFSILDWIIDYVNRTHLPDGNTFIKIYRKYGGRKYSELKSWKNRSFPGSKGCAVQ